MEFVRRHWSLLLVAAAGAVLYARVLRGLVTDWSNDGNSSHGFLVVPLAGYFAWERRARLAQAPRRPSIVGLVVVLGSLATLVVGILGAEFFLSRVSILGVIAGTVLFLFGLQHLRILAFPLAFLLLM